MGPDDEHTKLAAPQVVEPAASQAVAPQVESSEDEVEGIMPLPSYW